jgi:hypothetical protein
VQILLSQEKNDLIGQARFVRALMHFKLSQLFGKQLKQDQQVVYLFL